MLCRLLILESKVYLFFLLFCFPFVSLGQNLVPNPSFEDFDQCPPYPGQIHDAVAWDSPNNNTTDYFHVCSPEENGASVPSNLLGFQQPASGSAYAGIRTWIPTIVGNPIYREYLGIKLAKPLEAGMLYNVQFKISLAETSSHTSDDIGAYFSMDPPANERLYEVNPQIQNPVDRIIYNQSDWVSIRASFKADGGEQFMLIGTFQDDESITLEAISTQEEPKVYFYIDDVIVEPCSVPDQLTFIVDTTFCKTQSIDLIEESKAWQFIWNDQTTGPQKRVSQAGSYKVVSDFGCYQTQTTYRVTEIDCSCQTVLESPLGLEPFVKNGQFRLPPLPDVEVMQLSLFDMMGRQIAQLFPDEMLSFDSFQLHAGTYFYQLQYQCLFEKDQTFVQSGKLILIR